MNKWKYNGHGCKHLLQTLIPSSQMERKMGTENAKPFTDQIASQMSSPLGFNFQKSIKHSPLLWLEGPSLGPDREEAIRNQGTRVLCFLHTILSHPLCMAFLDLTGEIGIPGHTEATLCPRQLFCQQKKNHSLETYQVYQECTFTFFLPPALISSFLTQFNITEFHKFHNSCPRCPPYS